MGKTSTQKAKRRAEKKAKKLKAQENNKPNLLPYTLKSLIQRQQNLPTVNALQTTLETWYQLPNKTDKDQELDKMLSAAIAYKQDNLSDRAAAAIQQQKQIFILDSEQNLILKVSTGIGKIKYQGIVFTLKQVRTACNRVNTLKAEFAKKLAEQSLAKLLAQIPAKLEAKIKALQQQAEQHWDKLSLLNSMDLKFIEGYQRPHFNFSKVENTNIQTQVQMNDWIRAWIKRVETAIVAPSLADVSTQTILGLIACSPKYGIQTYAMWLSNSKAKTLEEKKLDKTFRAALKNNTIAAIAAKIEAYIDYEWLTIITVGTHHLPVLKLTERGKKVLQRLEQKKIKTLVAQPTLNAHSHLHWFKQIQQQEHTAYIEFLNTPQSIANIAMWTQDEIVAMQQLLNERLKAWQVLAKWKLSKHPIKYKPLQRLLC